MLTETYRPLSGLEMVEISSRVLTRWNISPKDIARWKRSLWSPSTIPCLLVYTKNVNFNQYLCSKSAMDCQVIDFERLSNKLYSGGVHIVVTKDKVEETRKLGYGDPAKKEKFTCSDTYRDDYINLLYMRVSDPEYALWMTRIYLKSAFFSRIKRHINVPKPEALVANANEAEQAFKLQLFHRKQIQVIVITSDETIVRVAQIYGAQVITIGNEYTPYQVGHFKTPEELLYAGAHSKNVFHTLSYDIKPLSWRVSKPPFDALFINIRQYCTLKGWFGYNTYLDGFDLYVLWDKADIPVAAPWMCDYDVLSLFQSLRDYCHITFEEAILPRDYVALAHGYKRILLKTYAKEDGTYIFTTSGHLQNLMLMWHFAPICFKSFMLELEFNLKMTKGEPQVYKDMDKAKLVWGMTGISGNKRMQQSLWHSIYDYLLSIEAYRVCCKIFDLVPSEELCDYISINLRRLLVKYPNLSKMGFESKRYSRDVLAHLRLGLGLETFAVE